MTIASSAAQSWQDQGVQDALHEGYATQDLYHWVCPQCFADMRERFQLELLP